MNKNELKRDEVVAIILHFARNIFFVDVSIVALVGLICFLSGFRTFEAFGTLLVRSGVAVLFFACLIGIGGFSSRAKDVADYSISGAGNMSDNLRQITNARSSNLGCFLQLIFMGLGLIGFGYLIQIITVFF